MLRVTSVLCAIAMACAFGAEAAAAVVGRATISFDAHGEGTSPYTGYPEYAGFGGSVEFLYQDALEKYSLGDVITANLWGYAGYANVNFRYDKYNPIQWSYGVFEFDIDLREYNKTGRLTDIIGGVGYYRSGASFGVSFDRQEFFGTDFNHAYINSSQVSLSYSGAGFRQAPIPLPPTIWLLTAALTAAGVLRSRRARQAKSASALIAS